jgi:hypothetical protein
MCSPDFRIRYEELAAIAAADARLNFLAGARS